jgi:hypothetical protein
MATVGSAVRFLRRMAHTAMRDTRAGFDIAERPRTALGITSAVAGPRHPNLLLDGRRRLVGQVGRAVVGEAFQIGADQGLLGSREGASLAAVDLRGQQDD